MVNPLRLCLNYTVLAILIRYKSFDGNLTLEHRIFFNITLFQVMLKFSIALNVGAWLEFLSTSYEHNHLKVSLPWETNGFAMFFSFPFLKCLQFIPDVDRLPHVSILWIFRPLNFKFLESGIDQSELQCLRFIPDAFIPSKWQLSQERNCILEE